MQVDTNYCDSSFVNLEILVNNFLYSLRILLIFPLVSFCLLNSLFNLVFNLFHFILFDFI